jgi:uncharacterized repeat protein (TIGR01451 family)
LCYIPAVRARCENGYLYVLASRRAIIPIGATCTTATVFTSLTNSAALTIVDTIASPHGNPLTEGVALTYDLTLTNNGPSDAQDVVVSFTLPAQLNAIVPVASLTNSGTGQTIIGVLSGNIITFTIPTLSGVAGNATSLNAAVTEMATGLANVGQGV